MLVLSPKPIRLNRVPFAAECPPSFTRMAWGYSSTAWFFEVFGCPVKENFNHPLLGSLRIYGVPVPYDIGTSVHTRASDITMLAG